MGKEKLVTLLEMAEEIDVNYRTLISCKRELSEFVFGTSEGRLMKYAPEYTDFFVLIFALKDQGYTVDQIRMMLNGDIPDNMDNKLIEWVTIWKNRIKAAYLQMDGLTDGWMDGLRDEGINGLTDDRINGLTDEGMDGSVDGGMTGLRDESMDGVLDDGMNGLRDEPSEKGIHGSNFSESQLPQLKDELQQELYAAVSSQAELVVQKKIKALTDALEDTLLNLTAEINGSMVQVYKALTQIQQVMKNLEERLGQLENDLGADPAEGVELSDLDLEKMQVSHPSINLVDAESIPEEAQETPALDDYAYADLEFVKNSVFNGKPDKAAVTQWIRLEREKDPGISYVELAKRLNEAKIPTLSGREEWTRMLVRNLAVR